MATDAKIPRIDRIKSLEQIFKFAEDVIRALEKVQEELQRLQNTKQDV